MPENESQDSQAATDLAEVGAAAHERFVADCKAADIAFAEGRLDEWLQEKLANEQRKYGIDPDAAS